MFKEKRDGLCYEGSDGLEYELLEGISSNGFTSDIIFIIDRNDKDGEINPGIIISFVYGGFRHLEKDFIKEEVEKYIKNKEVI
jgi:hypothetical protein